MSAAGELTGPKVHVERVGTADSGAGQVAALAGNLLIRGTRHTRSLLGLHALVAIELQDRSGTAALLRCADGSAFRLTETRDDTLLPFLRQLAEQCPRPGLIVNAPTVSMQVREAIGAERKPALITLALGLAAMWPLAALCALWPWLGYALMLCAVAWLAVLVLVELDQLELPRKLRTVQWALKFAVPIMVVLAAGLGVLDGRQRAATQEATLRVQNAVARAQVAAAAKRKQDAASRELEIARAADDLKLALHDGNPELIERQATRLRALSPQHTALARLPTVAAAPPPPQSEPERVAALAEGVRAARRVTSDPVRCDAPREVSDAWRGLKLARAGDPQLREARRLASKLERCRMRVRRALIENAARTRGAELARAARQLEHDLRGTGRDASVEVLAGQPGTIVAIVVPGLTSQAADTLLRPGDAKSLERAGAGGITLGDGVKSLALHELSPSSLEAFASDTLAAFELAEPLALR